VRESIRAASGGRCAQRTASSTPHDHTWQCFWPPGASPARRDEAYEHTSFLARVKRNTWPASIGLCRPGPREILAKPSSSPNHRHNPEVGIMMIVPTSAQSSAQARACCRARTRRRAAAGHPAAARAFVRLDHERLPARDRRRGDHRHDSRAASADDARQRRPRTLRRGPSQTGSGEGRGALPRPARAWALLLFANAAATPTTDVWPLLLNSGSDRLAAACSPEQKPRVTAGAVQTHLLRTGRGAL
jgi:hypothetical protein